MAGGPQQDQGASDKNSYYILWMLFLIAIVGYGIWYFFAIPLKQFFIGLRKYELLTIYSILTLLPLDYLPWIKDSLMSLTARVGTDLRIAQDMTVDNLNLDSAAFLSQEVGEFLRFPVSLILVGLAWYVYHNHLHRRFTRKHSMQSLLTQEEENWPQIKIVRKLNLVDQDIDVGPWAMAMTPLQFSKKYNLIEIVPATAASQILGTKEKSEFNILLDKSRAQRLFAAQLGRAWQNMESMPEYRRALMAVFMARGGRDTKVAQNMVYQLGDSAGDGKLDFRGVEALWKKHINNKSIQRIMRSHAYEFTLFASMLQFAREDGVLASADFLWLKPMDRRLWYVVNNVGRQTPTTEVAGIFCHWYNELAVKRPLSVPIVDNAVVALELSLAETRYVPTEEEREEIMKRAEERQRAEDKQRAEELAATGTTGT